MGKKAGGGWLATVRKVFKPAASSKDLLRHANAKKKGGEAKAAGGEAAEVVSVEHFPAADETSPEVTNEGVGGAVVWLGPEDDYAAEVAGGRRERRHHRGTVRMRGKAERAAVRIQAFYRGYLARRALRALRGLVRLQALVRGHQVRRQVQRTMRSMQALVRAQDRVRARRLVTSSPYHDGSRALPRDVPVLRHGGRRSSFGHDRDAAENVGCEQAPPRHSNASPFPQQETMWHHADGGVMLRHDTMAAARAESASTYDYGFHHRQRQERRDERDAGLHWMEPCNDGVQHAPEQSNQHGAAETSYVTAAATVVSENTVEMDQAASGSRRSPTRDLYPVRPPAILPGYMAATQSARAKARMAAPRAHAARPRSGSSTANMGWSVSHNNGGGGAGRPPQQRPATHSPESSCSGGDRAGGAAGRPVHEL